MLQDQKLQSKSHMKPHAHSTRENVVTSTIPSSESLPLKKLNTKNSKTSFTEKLKTAGRTVGNHLKDNWRSYALGAATVLSTYGLKKRYWDNNNNNNLSSSSVNPSAQTTNTNKAPVLSSPPVKTSVPSKINTGNLSVIQPEKEINSINRSINLPVKKTIPKEDEAGDAIKQI